MEDRKINISAYSVKEFENILAKLATLPKAVRDQIEKAEYSHMLKCTYEAQAGNDIKILLPDGCEQISDFGDYVGCYCRPNDVLIHVPKKYWTENTKVSYILMQPEPKPVQPQKETQ